MSKINAQDVYKTFWKCRDLEIQHYWHRIVFMTAFLLGCFTAYGGWIGIAVKERGAMPFVVGNGVGFCIALIGIVCSLLWIMMAKGSKAWYEEYEHLIEAFVEVKVFFESDVHNYVGLEYYDFPRIRPADVNDFLWSTKAGAYSVSKIGVAIGHITVTIWGVIGFVHLFLSKSCTSWTQAMDYISGRCFDASGLTVMGAAVLLLFWLYGKQFLFSSYFKKRKY